MKKRSEIKGFRSNPKNPKQDKEKRQDARSKTKEVEQIKGIETQLRQLLGKVSRTSQSNEGVAAGENGNILDVIETITGKIVAAVSGRDVQDCETSDATVNAN